GAAVCGRDLPVSTAAAANNADTASPKPPRLADALAAPDGPSLRRVTSLRQTSPARLLPSDGRLQNSVVVSIDQPASESAADSTATSATSRRQTMETPGLAAEKRRAAASSELSALGCGGGVCSADAVVDAVADPRQHRRWCWRPDQLSAGTAGAVSVHADAELTKAYVAESPDEAALVRAACRQRLQAGAAGRRLLPGLAASPTVTSACRCSACRLRCAGPARGRPTAADTDSDADRVLLLTRLHMEQYSVAGLRTLCLAVRYLDEAEYADWLAEYTLAQRRIQGREAAMARAFDRLEAGLELLGATGVEDRLQEGAADTVAALARGRHQASGCSPETSRKLRAGRPCLPPAHRRPTAVDAGRGFSRRGWRPGSPLASRTGRRPIRSGSVGLGQLYADGVALVLDGRALRHCLDELVSCDFLLLAEQCSSVLCCRTTPSQKAAVVGLVKESLGMQTLAIGDGANDVSMIQTADIGVGISGQEGMQAVMAADFSLARFRFLKKLLLVHGHWCYDRLARMSLYLFYKNCVYIMMLFWYQLFNGFSGQVNIGQVYQICFNLTMTSLGPLVIGILDRHLSAEILMANPVLYTDAQNCRSYLPWHFWLNILDAVWQSLVVFFVAYLGAMDTDCGIWSFGDTVVSAGVITPLWRTTRWRCALDRPALVCAAGPLIAWFAFAIVLNLVCTNCLHPDNPYYSSAKIGNYSPALSSGFAPSVIGRVHSFYQAPPGFYRRRLRLAVETAAQQRVTLSNWPPLATSTERRWRWHHSVAAKPLASSLLAAKSAYRPAATPHRLPLQTRPRTFPARRLRLPLSQRCRLASAATQRRGVGGGRRVRTRSASSAAATAAAGRRASWRHRSAGAGGNGADWPIALDGAATAPPQRRSKSVCSRPAAAASATATPATAAAPQPLQPLSPRTTARLPSAAPNAPPSCPQRLPPNASILPLSGCPNASILSLSGCPNASILSLSGWPPTPPSSQRCPTPPSCPQRLPPNAPILSLSGCPNASILSLSGCRHRPILSLSGCPTAPILSLSGCPNASILTPEMLSMSTKNATNTDKINFCGSLLLALHLFATSPPPTASTLFLSSCPQRLHLDPQQLLHRLHLVPQRLPPTPPSCPSAAAPTPPSCPSAAAPNTSILSSAAAPNASILSLSGCPQRLHLVPQRLPPTPPSCPSAAAPNASILSLSGCPNALLSLSNASILSLSGCPQRLHLSQEESSNHYLTIAKALEKIRISSATMRVLQLCLFLCVLCSAVLARPPPMERPYSAGTQGAGRRQDHRLLSIRGDFAQPERFLCCATAGAGRQVAVDRSEVERAVAFSGASFAAPAAQVAQRPVEAGLTETRSGRLVRRVLEGAGQPAAAGQGRLEFLSEPQGGVATGAGSRGCCVPLALHLELPHRSRACIKNQPLPLQTSSPIGTRRYEVVALLGVGFILRLLRLLLGQTQRGQQRRRASSVDSVDAVAIGRGLLAKQPPAGASAAAAAGLGRGRLFVDLLRPAAQVRLPQQLPGAGPPLRLLLQHPLQHGLQRPGISVRQGGAGIFADAEQDPHQAVPGVRVLLGAHLVQDAADTPDVALGVVAWLQ
uniref:PhoLip_ATPase_C domain-containing protein n=1 Tax=Macrostomum lignano TaxID=282301 RepID=A0A1I8F4J5_9PLAT